MYNYDLIQVLWVEDDPGVTETYPLKAESFGLELVPYPCWDDAKVALEKEYDRWAAIILDAKCKFHRDSADNAIVFLREALDDISTICEKKGRIIPWYILTGGSETDVSDSINDKRLKWDSDWTEKQHKKFYSKNIDNESLYERIKIHAQKSHSFQIREMYRDAFDQLSSLNSEEICEDIATVLEAMHYPKEYKDFTPRLYYNPLRKALECVFRTLKDFGVIPDLFFSDDRVNINQCFMYLIGNEAKNVGVKCCERIAPYHIQNMMSLIVNLGNTNSHSKLSELEIQTAENKILKDGMNSRYLVYSMTLQLCEIVFWMNRYIIDNPNKEDNLKKCIPLENDEKAKKKEVLDDSEVIGLLEEHEGICHLGTKFSVLLKHKEWLGKKIRIINYVDNTSVKTKQYPYFVREQDFVLIEEPENGSK